MAKLSNINGRFAVEDDGAIQFNGSAGVNGYVLESRGDSSPPVWTDRDTGNVIGTGTENKVVRWNAAPATGDSQTIGDGPITFSGSAATANSTFGGIVGMGSTGIYAGTNAQLNLPGRGLAIKNDKNGSDNNWSYIENTATGSSSNLNFYTGNNAAALTLAHNGDATFTGDVTTDGNVTIANSSPDLYFVPSASFYSFRVSAQENVANTFEITPSTAAGGSTYSNPALSISHIGNSTFAGNVTTDGIYKITTAPDGNILELDQGGRSMDIGVYFSSNSTDSEWQFKTSTGNVNGATTNALVIKPLQATFAGQVTTSQPNSGLDYPILIGVGSAGSGTIGYQTRAQFKDIHDIAFNIDAANLGSSQWVKIGTLSNFGQSGYTFVMCFYGHTGYNASNTQDWNFKLFMKTSNGNAGGLHNAFFNTWVEHTGNNTASPELKWVNTNASGTPTAGGTSFVLYMNVPQFVSGSIYTVKKHSGNWTSNNTTGQSDPGANSTTVLKAESTFNILDTNVGIGTASPSAKLEIKATGATTGLTFKTTDSSGNENFFIQDGGRAGVRYYPFTIGQTSGTSAASGARFQVATTAGDFVVLNDGKTGIGTDSPSANLHVSSTSTATLKVGTTGVADASVDIRGYDAGVHIGDATNGLRWAIWNDGPSTSSSLKFGSYALGTWYANSSQVVTMKSDGNVGIGTTTPSFQLSIENHDTTTSTATMEIDGKRTNGTDGPVGEMIFSNNGDTCATVAAYRDTADNRGALYFQTQEGTSGFSTKMIIRNSARIEMSADVTMSGSVGIGETTLQRKFNLYDGTDTWTRVRCGASTADWLHGIAGSDHTYKWYNQSSNGGVGYKMALATSGVLTVSSDVVAYGSPSDKRLKENIKPIESALDKVTKLQGVTFDWKKSNSILNIKEDIGFIAQDVQKVIPELVRENEDGMLSMRHQGIAPILLEAIKELKAEIEELKSNKCNCNK